MADALRDQADEAEGDCYV